MGNPTGWEHFAFTEMPDSKPLVTFPKLMGESNWSSWKRNFHEFLKSLGSGYMGILDGSIKPPVLPNSSQYLTTAHDSVKKTGYEDLMRREQFNNLTTPRAFALLKKRQELKRYNKDLQATFKKAMASHAALVCQVFNCLRASIDDTLLYIIASETDPHEAFEKLQIQFGTPSPCLIAQAYEKWTEMRFEGNDAADFVRRFQKAHFEYQDVCPDGVSHDFEFCVFVVAIMKNPRYVGFARELQCCATSERKYEVASTSDFQGWRGCLNCSFISHPLSRDELSKGIFCTTCFLRVGMAIVFAPL